MSTARVKLCLLSRGDSVKQTLSVSDKPVCSHVIPSASKSVPDTMLCNSTQPHTPLYKYTLRHVLHTQGTAHTCLNLIQLFSILTSDQINMLFNNLLVLAMLRSIVLQNSNALKSVFFFVHKVVVKVSVVDQKDSCNFRIVSVMKT